MNQLRHYDARFTVNTIGLFEHDATGLWKLREEVALRA